MQKPGKAQCYPRRPSILIDLEKRRETYHAVELAPLVPERLTAFTLRLASAELTEILGGFGDGVGEEFHFDAAEWLS